jgi:hypothetical protein
MEKARCRANSKRSGVRCKRYPVPGVDVCKMHGGGAPQVKAAAARRVVEGEALKAVSALGKWGPVTDPLSALADAAGEVTAVKDFLRGLVDDIVMRQADPLRVPDDKGAEQMRAEFTAYMAMLNTTVGTLATIAKLNIDERMARIDEARAEMIREALRRAFAEAGLAGEQQTKGLAAFGRHLRIVAKDGRTL